MMDIIAEISMLETNLLSALLKLMWPMIMLSDPKLNHYLRRVFRQEFDYFRHLV